MTIETRALETTPHRARGRRRLLNWIVAIVLAYVVIGFVRGPMVAQDYLARLDAGGEVSNVSTTTVPMIPPLWMVSITGRITQPNGTYYDAHLVLWIEPVTGYVMEVAAG